METKIRFVETDADAVAAEMIASFEAKAGRTLYPADPVRQMILWVAAIEVQARVNLNDAAMQNIPSTATGEHLDLLAELFKELRRMEAAPATTSVQFILSAARPEATTVPEGTRVTPDGTLIFATVGELTIPAGETQGAAAARCMTPGEAGNGFLPGQIDKMVDVLPYVASAVNTTASEGGSEAESDEAFRARMRENPESYSTAGCVGGYEYHAKSASALVADVRATSPSPAVVDVRVLLEGGALPGEELLGEIAAALSADKVRPLTDKVEVKAPDQVGYDIDVTYYTERDSAQSQEETAGRVADAVEEFARWQSERMGRDINPSRLVSLLMGAGIKRVEVRAPAYTAVDGTAVALLGETTVLHGGTEDG